MLTVQLLFLPSYCSFILICTAVKAIKDCWLAFPLNLFHFTFTIIRIKPTLNTTNLRDIINSSQLDLKFNVRQNLEEYPLVLNCPLRSAIVCGLVIVLHSPWYRPWSVVSRLHSNHESIVKDKKHCNIFYAYANNQCQFSRL